MAFSGEEWTVAERNRVSLGQVADAYARTQEKQAMYLTMLTGPTVVRKELGREPTTVEVLRYVRDRLSDRRQ